MPEISQPEPETSLDCNETEFGCCLDEKTAGRQVNYIPNDSFCKENYPNELKECHLHFK